MNCSNNQYDTQLEELYKHCPEDIDARIDYFSEAFLNTPYLNGALGEGPDADIDKNPLYRTDAFDCTTFVATVLALAQSQNLNAFKKNIIKVNYRDDTVSYFTRNHFMETDWNHKNQQNGFLHDITDNIVDEFNTPLFKSSTTLIDKQKWFAKKNLLTLSEKVNNESCLIHYIPLSALFDANGLPQKTVFDQIPHACVIEIVRPNWDLTAQIGTHLHISHMGFGLRKNGELIFRDASTITNTVRDILLSDYLSEYLDHPTIKGVHLQKIIVV